MQQRQKRLQATYFLTGFWVTSLGTLGSRALGLLRDAATASLLGLGGPLDALVLALRIPNLLRRTLGEGALANSYLPVLAGELERDRRHAASLATAVLVWLMAVLTLLVVVGEACCALAWVCCPEPDARLLTGLSAAVLPYVWFICLAAQLSATLHAAGRFALPALAASLLNVGWLAGAWWLAPALTTDRATQAYVLAGCIVVSGALQAAVQLPALWRLGIRPTFGWHASREPCRRVLRTMGPLALALAVTQINTLVDGVLAWGLAASPAGPTTIDWLPGAIGYPLRSGSAAALYFAERCFQLPVGLLGVAVATAIFPRLSRHAAQGRRDELGQDLTRGLQWVCFLALPASVGLVLLATPIARACFEHGAFDSTDATRTASAIVGYALGVCAYCALPVLARGFYALGDARGPLRASLAALGTNAALDLLLVWPLGEAGLALATAISSAVQLWLMFVVFSRAHAPLNCPALRITLAKAGTSTLALGAAVLLVGALLAEPQSFAGRVLHLSFSIAVGGTAFALAASLLRCEELAWFWPKRAATIAGPAATSARRPAAECN